MLAMRNFLTHFRRAGTSGAQIRRSFAVRTMKIDEATLQKIFQRIEIREREFVEQLKEAVAIPSISAEPEHREDCVAMVEWTKKALEQLGAQVELHKGGKQTLHDGRELAIPPIIFAILPVDKKKKTLLVYGHLDVQPAKKEDGWNTDPFTLTELDGKLYGRGATDDKGPVLAWLNAISTMQQLGVELPVNIKFVLECMEESGSEGLDHALTKHKDFLKDVDFSCISDNYFLGKEKPCLTYGLRGLTHYSVQIECAKQDLHSGTYGGSVPEAMVDLMAIMSQLKSVDGNILIPGLAELVAPLTLEEKKTYETIDFDIESYKKNDIGAHGLLHDTKENLLMSRFREPSLSIHGIEGAHSGFGPKTVIPSKVIGKFSIRLVPNMTPEAVSRCVLDYLNKLWKERGSPNKFEVISDAKASANPWLGDYTDRNFQAGVRAIERVFGCKPDFTREGGSIPVTLTLQEQTKKSVMLLPIGACDDMAHSQNEKINRVNYIRGTKTLAAYIMELADETD